MEEANSDDAPSPIATSVVRMLLWPEETKVSAVYGRFVNKPFLSVMINRVGVG